MSRSICPVLMVMSALFAQWLPAEAQDARPNILFIVMDDMGFSDWDWASLGERSSSILRVQFRYLTHGRGIVTLPR